MSREGVETPPLPPLTASIIVQCLEQDQWLVRIGESLLDAFLIEYISSNYKNAKISLAVTKITSVATLASFIDNLDISAIRTPHQKRRSLLAFIGAINRELNHETLTDWLEKLFTGLVESTMVEIQANNPKDIISIDDSDDENIDTAETSLMSLSICDDLDQSFDITVDDIVNEDNNPTPLGRVELPNSVLVPTLANTNKQLDNDNDDIHKLDRMNYLNKLKKTSINKIVKGRPMSEYGLDLGVEYPSHPSIHQMPTLPPDFPPPLPWLSDKGLYETLTPRGVYTSLHRIKGNRFQKSCLIYDNERLEFLGDTVLETVVTDAIYDKFPLYQPNELTKLRSKLINNNFLSYFSDLYGLSEKLQKVPHGSILSNKKKADTFEAYIGALYRESGHSHTNKWLIELLEPFIFKHAQHF